MSRPFLSLKEDNERTLIAEIKAKKPVLSALPRVALLSFHGDATTHVRSAPIPRSTAEKTSLQCSYPNGLGKTSSGWRTRSFPPCGTRRARFWESLFFPPIQEADGTVPQIRSLLPAYYQWLAPNGRENRPDRRSNRLAKMQL